MIQSPETFRTDPRLLAKSVAVAAWALCDVRLMDDARFPWLVLIPRVASATEIDDLDVSERALVIEEMVRAGDIVRALGLDLTRPVDKVNTAALGNVTAQLHIHVVGRRRDDPLWPDPIWGRAGAAPRAAGETERLAAIGRSSPGVPGP
ncbi:HIT domain-containing protein [soil metagenome]